MTRVLFTGLDLVTKMLGTSLVAGLESRNGVEALSIHAVGADQARALSMIGEVDILALNPASLDRTFDASAFDAASSASKRIVIVSDTWQKWRQVAPELRAKVDALTVCFPEEVEEARAGGYVCPIIAIIPPHWGAMYHDIVNARIVGPDDELPLVGGSTRRRGDMKLVYFGGAKNPPLMNEVLRATAAAMPANGVLCFRPHPAEGADEATLAERASFLASVPMLDHKAAGLDSPNVMVANADVSVFVGGPTDSIGGAYARRPMLYFDDPDVVAHNLSQNLPDGRWFVPERHGAAYASANNMHERIDWLLAHPEALRGEQERNFPLPATWDTAPALAAVILDA